MMKIFYPVFILLISLGSLPVGQTGLSAQTFKVNFKGQPSANVNAEVIDTLKILSIMVNFQEDRDGATFGNGKFGSIYSIDYGFSILDPLPHDAQYFKDHLSFVHNYFQKVSNDKLHIEFTVLPDTFSVSQTMRNYSPSPGSDDFAAFLAAMTASIWSRSCSGGGCPVFAAVRHGAPLKGLVVDSPLRQHHLMAMHMPLPQQLKRPFMKQSAKRQTSMQLFHLELVFSKQTGLRKTH